MTHEFDFAFTSRKQFYDIVRLLNSECGKGNWTIKGKVLKGLKRIEQTSAYSISHMMGSVASVNKTVVVPADKQYVEAMVRFVYTDERLNT